MAPGRPASGPPVHLLWGDDDFALQRRARQIFDTWNTAHPGGDAEIIDATAANADEARRAIARLREALQTLPFFGGSKSVWFRDCNFAGEGRVSEAAAVVQELADLGRELAAFPWKDVRLLLTCGKLDRRRAFFKALDKMGDAGTAEIEQFAGLTTDDRDWHEKAERIAARELHSHGKKADPDVVVQFVEWVGPNSRQLFTEAQKLATYVGERSEITTEDVEAVVTRGRHARAFALADAVGQRDLPRALQRLDEELWAIQSDRQRSTIGLVYGLIAKIRAMLLVGEMQREGLLRPSTEYGGFVAQLKRLRREDFPADKRYNPLDINAYVLFRAALQAKNYSSFELVRALEELLRCNRLLVGSGLDEGMVLQLAIKRIVERTAP
jgi:DNA polymerase-3 subunit delta